MTYLNNNRAHLNYIAKRLSEGRAVVMIGAGFSKNASSKYPNWSELGDKLYELANGREPENDAKSYLSLLKVAEEAEATVGRPALDSFLMDSIPDKEIEPSQLHTDLLNLGWRDVFTTNYDTLLERASEKVDKFKYSPVLNQNDLCSAKQPRIVKLHGSFRHSRPFVVTEEDYRKYPTDNAPFVNTVLQSLLENTLVLVGFSGDDPNFIQWIGWIRDKLGNDHTQHIYLVTAFEFSPAQKALLACRNINIVNMAGEVGVHENQHGEALKLFIGKLGEAELDKRSWPKNEKQLEPNHGKLTVSKLCDAQKIWQSQRTSYPGWVILPNDNRELLYYKTRRYFDCEFDKDLLEQMTKGRDLEFLYELNWRLDHCLTPLNKGLVKAIKSALSREHKESIKIKLHEEWCELGLSLLRYNREVGDVKEYDFWFSRLSEKLSLLSSEQREFLNYQEYLFSLSQLDLDKAKSILKKWNPKDSQPFWKHIRMACMLELGVIVESANGELETYLFETRQLGRYEDSFYFDSTEAYQMLLVRAVNFSNYEEDIGEDEVREVFNKEFNKRNPVLELSEPANIFLVNNKSYTSQNSDWQDLLKNKLSNRKEEWRKYELAVKSANLKRKEHLITSRLDELKSGRIMPREEVRLLELTINNKIQEEGVAALQFIRMQEEAVAPFRFDCVLMFSAETISNVLSQLLVSHSHLAETVLMRAGDTKSVSIVYSYERLLTMTIEEIDKQINQYCECFKRIYNNQTKQSFETMESRWFRLIPEILSYLIHKCSNKYQDQIIETIALFGRNLGSRYLHDYERLLTKVFSALSEEKLIEWLPELIALSESQFEAWPSSLNPIIRLGLSNQVRLDTGILKQLINSLERKVSSPEPNKREWALTCLFKLWDWNFMDDEQKRRFGKSLWSDTDSDGFPSDTSSFYRFAFLDAPGNRKTDVLKLFKNYVIKKCCLLKENLDGADLKNIDGQLLTEMIGASKLHTNIWTEKEGVNIFENTKTWWHSEKGKDDKQGLLKLCPEECTKEKLRHINKLLADVVIPAVLSSEGTQYEKEIIELIKDMNSYQYETLQAEAEFTLRVNNRRESLINNIRNALYSSSENLISEAHWAISRCLTAEDKAFRCELNQLLAGFIEWHTGAKLEYSLWVIVRLIKDKPKHLDDILLKALLNRIVRLEKELDYSDGSSMLTLKEKLKLKETTVLLVSKLNVHFKKKAIYQKVINQWKTVSNDKTEFAEVKNAWISISNS